MPRNANIEEEEAKEEDLGKETKKNTKQTNTKTQNSRSKNRHCTARKKNATNWRKHPKQHQTPLRDQANENSKSDSKFGKRDGISDFSKNSPVGVVRKCNYSKVRGRWEGDNEYRHPFSQVWL